MTLKYLIATIGNGADSHATTFKSRIRKRLRELSESLPRHVGFLNSATVLNRDLKCPIVAVYFGIPGSHSAADLDAASSLLQSASVIIPVVDSLGNFTSSIPTELLHINGSELGPNRKNLDAIVNTVLENLGLLRRTRRLFISYKRTESASVALQLRHLTEACGYDVFLDTHSVPKGDDFQDVLWHRLSDSDLVILLDTPGFLESRWTKEELAQAEAMSVGIVQLIWPDTRPAPYSELCERLYLAENDFSDPQRSALSDATAAKILIMVEQIRARCLAARHDNLVREFCEEAVRANSSTAIQPDRFILVRTGSGKRIAAVPAVGVVDANRYHEASLRFPVGNERAEEVFLIYDHRGLRAVWSTYLSWLDEFLPVKAVRVTSVSQKLKDL